MDERRFDDLVRNLSTTGRSRRSVLKGLMAGALSGAVGLVGTGGALAAKGGNTNGGSKKPDCCPDTAPRLCDNHCVDYAADTSNCGGCGNVCPDGATCVAGACHCPATDIVCGNTCVDTSSDPNNCGTCGTTCPAGASCVSGNCACPNGTTSCGNNCVDTSSDPNNCGTCGNACPTGSTCQAGSCVAASQCQSDFDCPAGFHCSSGICVANQCVSDGAACQLGDGSTGVCSHGICVALGGCTPGMSQPCTVGLGVCGRTGTITCQADGTWSSCSATPGDPSPEICNGLDDDCDGVIDNVDPGLLANDVNNCGACGNVCIAPNGTAGCVNGTCVVAACNEGFADCDDNPANGCEVNVMSDVNNCGACGKVCGSNETCVAGICQPV